MHPNGLVRVRVACACASRAFWGQVLRAFRQVGPAPVLRPSDPKTGAQRRCSEVEPCAITEIDSLGAWLGDEGSHVHPVEGRRTEVDTPDHVAVDGIEHRVRESDTAFQGHRSRQGSGSSSKSSANPGLVVFGGSARREVDPLERPIRPCADRSPERFVKVRLRALIAPFARFAGRLSAHSLIVCCRQSLVAPTYASGSETPCS